MLHTTAACTTAQQSVLTGTPLHCSPSFVPSLCFTLSIAGSQWSFSHAQYGCVQPVLLALRLNVAPLCAGVDSRHGLVERGGIVKHDSPA